MDVEVRDLKTVDDCRQVVDLERAVWGYTDPLDIVPVPILVITIKRGGVLIGAFAPDRRMVGFVYSLPGLKDGRPIQWSHMLGVLDEWRNSGLGRRLKLEQRQRALDMGLDLIEWTFDPMQALNAHFNLRKLGVVVRDYAPNLYGDSSSPLHRGTPTDRLIAQWWIRDRRVLEHLSGPPENRLYADAAPVNRLAPSGRWFACRDVILTADAPTIRIEIPTGFGEMQAEEPDLARDWRLATRELFTTYFSRGYVLMDFALDHPGRRGSYVLRAEPS